MDPAPRQLAGFRASGLAFLVAGATLFTQVLVHRMVSAKLLNNYAFLVISLTMLGFALSGVVLTRALPGILARIEDVVQSEPLGDVTLKGIAQPVVVFNVTGVK